MTRLTPSTCVATRERFSTYLDGAVTGVEMGAIGGHLQTCTGCASEFVLWRQIQATLTDMSPAAMPAQLQAQLRTAIAIERKRGSHLSFLQQARRLWSATLAPAAFRVAGGLVAALVLAGGLGFAFGAPIQANDDRLAHLIAPRYLSSAVPPQPIVTRYDAPIVVEAKVDTDGRVYDFAILEGPQDAKVLVQVQANLLNSTFAPATVFGVPVRGHVVLTYTGVSVRG